MARFRIRFLKSLCDDTGHSHKCVQGVVDIHWARDRDRAVQAAKRRFERMKKIPCWNLHADTFELDHVQEGLTPARRALIRPS